MYNGLQVKLDKRFSGGFSITTAYTWSKSMGYQSEDAGIDFYINGRRNWHVLDFNRTHYFVQSYVYELPFGKGKKMLQSGPARLGCWAAGRSTASSASHPARRSNFAGTTAVLKAPGNTNTLNWFGPGGIQITKGNGRTAPWFKNTICNFNAAKGALVTTDCFAQPGAENGGLPEFGNLGWNNINGPGYLEPGRLHLPQLRRQRALYPADPRRRLQRRQHPAVEQSQHGYHQS